MSKIFLVALLAAFASVTTMPFLGKALGPTAAYAGNHNDQGQDHNDQGQDLGDQGQDQQ